MNNEVGSATTATRTSGLAIASFVLGLLSCLCLPAPVAMVLGVVALVQMGKDPNLKGKGFAIAGLVLPLAMVPVILAAIAIPNFVKFQARSKQAEAKMNLKSLAVAQQSRMDEGPTENVKDLGFSPEPNHRFAYLLSGNPVAGETAIYGDHKEAMSELDVKEALRKPLAGNAVIGIDPETSAFTAVAVGNIDGDDGVDIWSVSSVDREGPDGTIDAWSPFNEWSDVTDSVGTVSGASSSSRSKFDD